MAYLFGVITSLGVIASLLFSAWQTRELTRQTAINNGIAGAAAGYNSLERLHAVDSFIATHPWLYNHFYGGAPIPDDPEQRARVLALVNMFADSIGYGLMTTTLAPAIQGYEGWREFALSVRSGCPALVQAVGANPGWYPTLAAHWNSHPESDS